MKLDNSKSFTGKQYWKSLDEAADTPEFREWLHREFPSGASEVDGIDRRHFLKIMAASFTFAGLGLSGCREPEQHLLPYSKQPEYIVPGVPMFYATSMPRSDGNIPLIVETHDARPTKVEGNPSYKAHGGSTDVFAQASILDLYDPDRSKFSLKKDQTPLIKADVLDLLKSIYEQFKATKGKGLAFLAEPSTSPSRARVVELLQKNLPEALWVEYEPIDNAGIEKALTSHFGQPIKPVYHFEKAKRVLALDSDFITKDPGFLQFARAFANARRVKNSDEAKNMNRLYVAESDFTNTGTMGDHRLRIASSHIPALTALLAIEVFTLTNGYSELISTLKTETSGLVVDQKWIHECARDLVDNAGQSIVIAGPHLPASVHLLVLAINEQLNAAGNTINYVSTSKNNAQNINELAEAINGGLVNALIILEGNPAYNAPSDLNWTELQKKIQKVFRFGYHYDETSKISDYHIALNHYLESWGDGRTYDGAYVPVQPMILPLFEGFSDLEILARLGGEDKLDPHAIVKETFESMHPGISFEQWLAVGVVESSEYKNANVLLDSAKLSSQLASHDFQVTQLSKDNLELRFTPSRQMYDGRYNNNGWLQEFPEPMTRLTWDNAIIISPRLAKELEEISGVPLLPTPSVMSQENQTSVRSAHFKRGKEQAYIAEINLNGKRVRGPIHIQPGLANYTVVLPLGYGRTEVGRVGAGTGFDVYPLITSNNTSFATGARINVTHDLMQLANTQEHWSMEGRAIIRESNAEQYFKHPHFATEMGEEAHGPVILGAAKNKPLQQVVRDIPRGNSLYKTPSFLGEQQWGMSVDLNTCNGCGACVVACQSENNIAIVGKDQVLRGREMHWIRMDRYFSVGGANKTEIPEDPQVAFMSVLCQHCELAPCENVCPVNATVHDEEGLNVMAYNRCVGTRYCANNCPWKVRRFNFFDWNKRQIGHFYEGPLGPSGMPELTKMQKNPNVTVRMRGVMEKCTYCVQRIESAKINQRVEAKNSPNIKVLDGAIKTACQQVCPTESLIFGDIADANTQVSKLKAQDRNYSLLGYLNTRPRTTYLAKLRNPNPAMPDYYEQPMLRMEYETRYGHEAYHTHDDHEHEHHDHEHHA